MISKTLRIEIPAPKFKLGDELKIIGDGTTFVVTGYSTSAIYNRTGVHEEKQHDGWIYRGIIDGTLVSYVETDVELARGSIINFRRRLFHYLDAAGMNMQDLADGIGYISLNVLEADLENVDTDSTLVLEIAGELNWDSLDALKTAGYTVEIRTGK